MDRVAIAVVGAGAIGRKHIEVLATSASAKLAAVVGPAPAAELAQAHGVPHLERIADLRGVAGVILATPTPVHLQGVTDCIALGLPVLVEKPVTPTADEAATLAQAAALAGVPILVGHHRRHNPLIAAAQKAIRDGRLGWIVAVQGSVLLSKPNDYFAPEWRRAPGAGPVLMNLIHDIDLMRLLVGEIATVQAITSNAVRGFAVEDSGAVLLRFAGGALGTIVVSDTAAAPWSWELTAHENPDYPPTGQSCLQISGTEGALELPGLRLWRHDGPRGWFTPLRAETLSAPSTDPLVVQIDHFAAVIRGQAAPLVTVTDAARSVAVVEAIQRAAATGSLIDLQGRIAA